MRFRILSVVLTQALAGFVAFSRYYLGYHTAWQVAVGALCGCSVGAFWHLFTVWILEDWFPWISNTKLARYFYVRNATHVHNLLRTEYMATVASEKAYTESKVD